MSFCISHIQVIVELGHKIEEEFVSTYEISAYKCDQTCLNTSQEEATVDNTSQNADKIDYTVYQEEG